MVVGVSGITGGGLEPPPLQHTHTQQGLLLVGKDISQVEPNNELFHKPNLLQAF